MLKTTTSDSRATVLSSLFPLMGIPACVVGGYLVDRLERKRNGEVFIAFSCLEPLGAVYQ